jgi:hypothetical protein
LVCSGAYRWLRHPIYTSMFCILLGTGFLFTSLPLFLTSIVVFTVGTEIRVRLEDALLVSRFGEQFRVTAHPETIQRRVECLGQRKQGKHSIRDESSDSAFSVLIGGGSRCLGICRTSCSN